MSLDIQHTCCVCQDVPEAMFVRAQAASNWRVGSSSIPRKDTKRDSRPASMISFRGGLRSWESNFLKGDWGNRWKMSSFSWVFPSSLAQGDETYSIILSFVLKKDHNIKAATIELLIIFWLSIFYSVRKSWKCPLQFKCADFFQSIVQIPNLKCVSWLDVWASLCRVWHKDVHILICWKWKVPLLITSLILRGRPANMICDICDHK